MGDFRLSDEHLPAVRFVVNEFLRRRRLAGHPVPPAVVRLQQHLSIMASTGHENNCDATQSETDLIGSAQAAQILGCSRRTVSRIHTDLDGRNIGGRMVYRRQTVCEYAHAKGIS